MAAWIPQVELLGDKRTKLFVSHAGNHGAHESIMNGVPILAIPLFYDQFYIATRIQGNFCRFFAYFSKIELNIICSGAELALSTFDVFATAQNIFCNSS